MATLERRTLISLLFYFLWGSVLGTRCHYDEAAQVNCSFTSDSEVTPLCGYEHWDDVGLYWGRVQGKVGESDYSPRYSALGLEPTRDTRVWGRWTDITSPTLNLLGPVCITFQYINQVCDSQGFETFSLYVWRSDDEPRILLRDYFCTTPNKQQYGWGNSVWLLEEIQFVAQPDDRLIFSAVQHGPGNDDNRRYVRIDDVMVYSGHCPGQSKVTLTGGNCDFEDYKLCGYTAEETYEEYRAYGRWRVVRRDNLYGREDDATKAPSGYFLAVTPESMRNARTDTVRTISPEVRIRAPSGCVRFNYRNAPSMNSTLGALKVILRYNDGNMTEEKMPPTFGDGVWATKYLNVKPGRFNMTFQVEIANYFTNYIGLDSVEVYDDNCHHVRCKANPCQAEETEVLCAGADNSPFRHLSLKCENQGKKYFSCSERIGIKTRENSD